MTTQRKLITAFAIIGGMVLLVLVARLAGRSSGIQVETAQVEARTIRSSILASGELQYKDPVELKPEVIGKISAIPVVEGQRVHKGQVLLRLDPILFQAQVAQQQATVQQAEIAIQSQKLTVANLKLQYDRQQQLYKQHLVDANSFDNLKNQLDLADTEMQNRAQSLQIAQAELAQSQQSLSKTVITSPLEGMITSLPVKVGETVITGTNIAGSTLMDIADPSEVLADVQVDEADIANVKLGEDANIDAVSFPDRTLHGKVQFVASSVTDTSNSLTASTSASQGRTFEVKIAIGDKDIGLLKPGMSARAEIFTQSTPDTLAVPVQAILYENDPSSKSLEPTSGAYVFMVEDGKAKKTTVATGVSSDTYQAVTSGLQKGDTVVSGSYQTLHHLADGSAVTPAPAASSKSEPKKTP
ncbi:MAG TPA: efflux RND transporter periplasmic adaptor subunit [Gammaproteobacteria bacterium]|jgi:HlyD family secretion protein|nr:efflux RND transporter periplasmic adaptor subunit [Gammaproteobacteria bacterium]